MVVVLSADWSITALAAKPRRPAFIREVTLPGDFLAPPGGCSAELGLIGDVTLPEKFFTPRPTVRLTFGAAEPLQGFQVAIAVPPTKGAFDGAADAVRCSADVQAQLVFNNQVASNVLTILPFPVTVSCDFDERDGETLTPGDIGLTVVEVVRNARPGDPQALSLDVEVD